MKFGILNLHQSLDITKNLDGAFLISDLLAQTLTNENGPNSTASNDVDLKLGLATKINKENKKIFLKHWELRHVTK